MLCARSVTKTRRLTCRRPAHLVHRDGRGGIYTQLLFFHTILHEDFYGIMKILLRVAQPVIYLEFGSEELSAPLSRSLCATR